MLDEVSVTADWRTREEQPGLADISFTVKVSRRAEAVSALLAKALQNSLLAESLVDPVVQIAYEEAHP